MYIYTVYIMISFNSIQFKKGQLFSFFVTQEGTGITNKIVSGIIKLDCQQQKLKTYTITCLGQIYNVSLVKTKNLFDRLYVSVNTDCENICKHLSKKVMTCPGH